MLTIFNEAIYITPVVSDKVFWTSRSTFLGFTVVLVPAAFLVVARFFTGAVAKHTQCATYSAFLIAVSSVVLTF